VSIVRTQIPEVVVPGKRLGRHIEHDPRSRAFETPHAAAPLISAKWFRHCAPFDQGDLGSCTGNAMCGAVMTEPLFRGEALTETDAVSVYSAATRLDAVRGVYPPTDTGSSGLAVARVARSKGYITSYAHAFSLQAALAALGRGPVIIGINWYDSFDDPAGAHAELIIKPGAAIRGGHEVELNEIDIASKYVRGVNSWGIGWGDGGCFVMSFDTLGRLLSEGGDCVVPRL
jgi:hypothetical protein